MTINSHVIKSTAVGALGGLLFGFDTAVISGATNALTKAYHLSPTLLGITVSSALVGTVIGFPEGTASLQDKLSEAAAAIADGADELDYVCNYEAFKRGDTGLVKQEILEGTALGIGHRKTVKWIIEAAALDDTQIAQLSALIKNVVVTNFTGNYDEVFVKSSTGFYAAENGKPNGATTHNIKIMLNNAAPLPVKAAGGVRSFDEAVEMVNLGVKRIGTSSAKAIAEGGQAAGGY